MKTPNIMRALSNANLPTLLPEGRCLLTKMVPVDDITKSEAIALKDQIATTKNKVKKYVK